MKEDELTDVIETIRKRTKRMDELMPTEHEALQVLFSACKRLERIGFKDPCYCPKDGTLFEVIEAGSTGIHKCHYEGDWPSGTFWIHDDEAGDLIPSRPILFREIKPKPPLTEYNEM